MGQVLRAYDKEVGEEIALKILHPEIALDERTVDRFRNEIKLARDFLIVREFHEEGAASPGDRGQSRFEVEHFRHRDLGFENPHIRLC
jgi:serine/threonine protein kinase